MSGNVHSAAGPALQCTLGGPEAIFGISRGHVQKKQTGFEWGVGVVVGSGFLATSLAKEQKRRSLISIPRQMDVLIWTDGAPCSQRSLIKSDEGK